MIQATSSASAPPPHGRSIFGITAAEMGMASLDECTDVVTLSRTINKTLSTCLGVYQTTAEEKNIAALAMKLNAEAYNALTDKNSLEALDLSKAVAHLSLDALRGSINGPLGMVFAETSEGVARLIYDRTGDPGKAWSALCKGFDEMRGSALIDQKAKTVATMMSLAKKGAERRKKEVFQAALSGIEYITKPASGSTASDLAMVTIQLADAVGDLKSARSILRYCFESLRRNEHVSKNERSIAEMGMTMGEELSVDDRLTSGVDVHLRNRIMLDDENAVKVGMIVLDALSRCQTSPVTAATALLACRAADGTGGEAAGFILNKGFGSIINSGLASVEDKDLAAEGRKINWTTGPARKTGTAMRRQYKIMEKIKFGALKDSVSAELKGRKDIPETYADNPVAMEEDFVDIMGVRLAVNK
jgi:hypothetical protein